MHFAARRRGRTSLWILLYIFGWTYRLTIHQRLRVHRVVEAAEEKVYVCTLYVPLNIQQGGYIHMQLGASGACVVELERQKVLKRKTQMQVVEGRRDAVVW